MKYYLICFIFSSFIFSSCSNDFELVEKGADIPVVYGLLSAQDTANYIRVEKAFINEGIPGDVLAKDPANLYFDDITVKIQHVISGKEYILSQVDGNKEGFKRSDDGAFASAPNYLYKIKNNQINLTPKEDYKLIVAKNDGSVLTEATTTVLTPLSDEKDQVEPKNSAVLNFGYNTNFKISWFPDENAVIHDLFLIINYTEILNNVTTEKSAVWKVEINNTSLQNKSYSISKQGRGFYDFLAGELAPSGPNNPVKRVFKDISIKILSAGQPLKDLIRVGLVNIGITSSGEIPVYSNMSNNARGIFTSKTEFIREGMGISRTSLDSLRNGVITKSLNFQ